MNSANALGAIAAVIILVTLFEMLRRHHLREKYALLWFVIAVGALVVALVPGALVRLADSVGVVLPSNLLFFISSLILLAMSLQHSNELGRLEERTRTLAEEIALLRLEAETSSAPERPGEPSAERPETEHAVDPDPDHP